MGVFHFFLIAQMVRNHAKHHICFTHYFTIVEKMAMIFLPLEILYNDQGTNGWKRACKLVHIKHPGVIQIEKWCVLFSSTTSATKFGFLLIERLKWCPCHHQVPFSDFIPLSANPTKWSNTLKQFVVFFNLVLVLFFLMVSIFHRFKSMETLACIIGLVAENLKGNSSSSL